MPVGFGSYCSLATDPRNVPSFHRPRLLCKAHCGIVAAGVLARFHSGHYLSVRLESSTSWSFLGHRPGVRGRLTAIEQVEITS